MGTERISVREGLRALMETEPGIDLVGEAGDGIEAPAWHECCTACAVICCA